MKAELESCGKLDRPEHAQTVVAETPRIDRPQHAAVQVEPALEWILVRIAERIPGDGVDCEITPPRRLFQAHERVANDPEPLVPWPGFGLAAGKSDVDGVFPLPPSPFPLPDHFVDWEALADSLDSSESLKQCRKPLLGDAEDLEVDVLGWAPQQPIAHPSPDNESPSSGVADGGRYGRGESE